MTLLVRFTLSICCTIAFVVAGCDSTEKGINSSGTSEAEGEQAPGTIATTRDGKLDMSAHRGIILQMTAEMVNLMDEVSSKKIMNPPVKVSDIRNAFMEQLDWIDEMGADDVNKLRQATADLEALLAEIRAHENAAGDGTLEDRLKKIGEWNRQIKEAIPK